MMATPNPLQTRLAASRKALVRHMARDDRAPGDAAFNDLSGSSQAHASDSTDVLPKKSARQMLRHAVTTWWQYHPAQAALDIGRPFLNNYARDKPLQLIGIAAGVGAAAAWVKPWRLISLTGVAVAFLKSPRLFTSVLALLPPRNSPPPKQRRTGVSENYTNP